VTTRLLNISILGLAAISIATAGQIEIGPNNQTGVSTGGLTAAYIGSTTWSEKNYVTNLFTSDTLSNTSSALPTAANGLQQFTDSHNSVTFAMDSDSGDNYWASPASSSSTVSTITVPVGVSGVSNAYVLLSDYFGLSGSSGINNDTVTFIFNNGAITDPVNLSDGVNIDSAHTCITGSCPSFSGTTTSGNTDIAWSGSYTEGTNLTPYSGTAGNVSLIDLTFNLSAFSGDILSSIQITDNNNLTNSSRLALSAVTVSGTSAQVVAPEPSTILLLLGGFGLMGFFYRRHKAQV